jgi:hypothetical protein
MYFTYQGVVMAKKRSRRRAKGPGIVSTLRDPKKVRVAYIIAGFALVFGGSLGFGASRCGESSPGQQRSAETRSSDIIATIGDHEITYYEYGSEQDKNRRNIDASGDGAILRPPEFWAEENYGVLRRMIDMEYFDIRSRDAGIEISEDKIEERYQEYRNILLPPSVNIEDRSLLERISDAFASVKEDKAFAESLKRIDPSLTPGRLRSIIEQELLAQEFIANLQAQMEQEIIGELSNEANILREEIIGGKDFGEAAQERSDHQTTSGIGGFLPMVRHTDTNLPVQIINSAFSLPIDEVSLPIIVTQPDFFGVWLLKVTSRKEASGDEWLEAREEIGLRLLDEKRQQIEQGIIEMSEEGTITVGEEEKINEYEEADIKIIYLKAEDPMGRVTQHVYEDQDTMAIVINDPQLRAIHHSVNQEWELAAVSYYEALEKNTGSFDPEMDNQYAIDMREANLRYLLAYMWTTRAFSSESEWLQSIWQQFQADPDAFAGAFPSTPENIKEEQQGYYVLALANLDRAIEFEEMQPWSRLARAQIDLAREHVSTRLIDDLATAHEYSSNDPELINRVLSSLNQLVAIDDRALEAAEDIRPETWLDPVYPETEMGITLEEIDAPFFDLIDTTETPEIPADELTFESHAELEISEVDEETSEEPEEAVDDTDIIPGEIEEEPVEELGEPVVEVEDNPDSEAQAWLPMVPVPEAPGPLTQELRNRVEELRGDIQTLVDIINAQRQAAEQQRQAMQQQQFELPPDEPPSAEAEDLLSEEDATEATDE